MALHYVPGALGSDGPRGNFEMRILRNSEDSEELVSDANGDVPSQLRRQMNNVSHHLNDLKTSANRSSLKWIAKMVVLIIIAVTLIIGFVGVWREHPAPEPSRASMARKQAEGKTGSQGLAIDANRGDLAPVEKLLDKIYKMLIRDDYDKPKRVCPNEKYGWVGPEFLWTYCYLFDSDQKLSMFGARSFCQQQNGDLVIIGNAAENKYVRKILAGLDWTGLDSWLGATDAREEGDWLWLDKTQMNYSSWNTNFQTHTGKLHCASMVRDGTWKDADCHKEKQFLCQAPSSSNRRTAPQPHQTKIPDKTCPENSTHCYLFVLDAMRWERGEQLCSEQGGYLAKVTSETENEFLKREANQTGLKMFWLGGRGDNTDMKWSSDGQNISLGFKDWKASPVMLLQKAPQCLLLNLTDDGSIHTWNKHHCYKWNPIICEIPGPLAGDNDAIFEQPDLELSEPVCATKSSDEKVECKFADNGDDYRGTQGESSLGSACLNWAVVLANAELRDALTQSEYAFLGVDNVTDVLKKHNLLENFCRNPGGAREAVWCFVNRGSDRNELIEAQACEVDQCDPEHFVRTDGFCGASHRQHGRPATCSAFGLQPCCGADGKCSNVDSDCTCSACEDFKKVKTENETTPTAAMTSTVASNTNRRCVRKDAVQLEGKTLGSAEILRFAAASSESAQIGYERCEAKCQQNQRCKGFSVSQTYVYVCQLLETVSEEHVLGTAYSSGLCMDDTELENIRSSSGCPANWITSGEESESCYYFPPDPKRASFKGQPEAREACQALAAGADLVSIESIEEQEALEVLMEENQDSEWDFWTSGKMDLAGLWHWGSENATIESHGFLNWDAGQPSASFESCLFIGHRRRFHHAWHDHICSYRCSFICELPREINQTAQNATITTLPSNTSDPSSVTASLLPSRSVVLPSRSVITWRNRTVPPPFRFRFSVAPAVSSEAALFAQALATPIPEVGNLSVSVVNTTTCFHFVKSQVTRATAEEFCGAKFGGSLAHPKSHEELDAIRTGALRLEPRAAVTFWWTRRFPTMSVRLTGGTGDHEGNVLVDGRPVCDDGWGIEDARVVCRQLGYRRVAEVHFKSHFGTAVSSVFIMDDVACNGMEKVITDCSYNSHDNCNAGESAGVTCSDYDGTLVGGDEEEASEMTPVAEVAHVAKVSRTDVSRVQVAADAWHWFICQSPISANFETRQLGFSRYRFYSMEKTWLDAYIFCLFTGQSSTRGQLAVVVSEEEEIALKSEIAKVPNNQFWVGGKCVDETDYHWVRDGKRIPFLRSQFDTDRIKKCDTKEDGITLSSSQFDDVDKDQAQPFVCEYR